MSNLISSDASHPINLPSSSSKQKGGCSPRLIVQIMGIFIGVIACGIAIYLHFKGFSLQHVIGFSGGGVGGISLSLLSIAICGIKKKEKGPTSIEGEIPPSSVVVLPSDEKPIILEPFIETEAYKTALHKAIQETNENEEIDVIAHAQWIDHRDQAGYTPYHWAIKKGRVDIIEKLHALHANSEVLFGDEGQSLIQFAVQNIQELSEDTQTKVLEALIHVGCQVNAPDKKGRTCLHTAALMGQLERMNYLVGKGALIDTEDSEGWTPLFLYAFKGFLIRNDLTVVHLTLYLSTSYIKDIHEVFAQFKKSEKDTNSKGWNLLHFAAWGGLENFLEPLLKAGLNVANSSGKFPVHEAALAGRLSVFKELHKLKSDLGLRDFNQNSILHLLASNGNDHGIQYLLENDLLQAVDATNKAHEKPFNCALKKGHFKAALRLIIWHETHIGGKWRVGEAELNLPQDETHKQTLRSLVIKENEYYRLKTINDLICEEDEDKSLLVIALYLEATCPLNQEDPHPVLAGANTTPPVHLACQFGKVKVLEFLEQAYHVIFTGDESRYQGREPIHTAITYGQSAVIEMLVKQKHVGCKKLTSGKWQLIHPTENKDNHDRSLYYYCLSHGTPDAIQTLFNLGGRCEDIIESTEELTVTQPSPIAIPFLQFLQPAQEQKIQKTLRGPFFLHAAAKGNYALFFKMVESGFALTEGMAIYKNGKIKGIVPFYELFPNPPLAVTDAIRFLQEDKIEAILEMGGLDEETLKSFDELIRFQNTRFSPFIIGLAVKKHQDKILQNLTFMNAESLKAVLKALQEMWKDQFISNLIGSSTSAFFTLFSVMTEEDKECYKKEIKLQIRSKFEASLDTLESGYQTLRNKTDYSEDDVKTIQKLCAEGMTLFRLILKLQQQEHRAQNEELLGKEFFSQLDTYYEKFNLNPGYNRIFNGLRDTIKEKVHLKQETLEEEEEIFGFINDLGYASKNTSTQFTKEQFSQLFGFGIEQVYASGLHEGIDAFLVGANKDFWNLIGEIKEGKFASMGSSSEEQEKAEKTALEAWYKKEFGKLKQVFAQMQNLVQNHQLDMGSLQEMEKFLGIFPGIFNEKFTPKYLDSLHELDKCRRRAMLKAYIVSLSGKSLGIDDSVSLSQWTYCFRVLKLKYGLSDAFLMQFVKLSTVGQLKNAFSNFSQEIQNELAQNQLDLEGLTKLLKIKNDSEDCRKEINQWRLAMANDPTVYSQFYCLGEKKLSNN